MVRVLLAAGNVLNRIGRESAGGAHALGGRFVHVVIPFYRAWWRLRCVTARASTDRSLWVARMLTSRAVTYSIFAVLVLILAAQTLHAREYGGFVGARPLLTAFVLRDAPEATEDVVLGPATRVARGTFRAASVTTGLSPTVLGAEAALQSPPPTVGFAILQPVLTDTAVSDSDRAGIETYVVEPGDTPSTIAERFGLETQTIFWENNLSAWSLIQPGQELRILPTDGVSYTVKRNDTLEAIAKRYGADPEEVLEFNRLVDADDLNDGDVLILPGGHPPAAPKPVPKPAAPKPVPKPLPSIPGKFFWPSESGYRISQYFTWRHHGLDVAVSYGTPVYASEAGVVVSSGWVSGYGYQVMIDHGNGLKTRYAHHSKNLVQKGQRIERGDRIAFVGSTGRSTGPHIHYEIYANGSRVNPLQYLR